MERLYVVTLLLLLVEFSGTQLQSSVERPCPRESVTFTCTMSSLGHDWQIPSLNISRGLLHRNKDMVFSDPPFQFTVTEVVPGTSITSTATINVTEDLNSTLVVCRDGLLVLPDQNSTINLRAPPAAPETPSVMISDSRKEFIVKWDEPPLSMGETVDTYFVNISGPSALCGSADKLQQVNARNYTCLIKTEPQEDETVIIRVQAANCGGNLRGPESEPVSVSLQAPPLVTSHPITAHPTTTHPTSTPSISTGYIDSMYSIVRRILIVVILCLTVVGIPIAIVLILFYMYSHKTGGKVEDVELKDIIPASFAHQWGETGDICTTPTKRKKTHKPEDHLPTYRPSFSKPPDTTGKAPDTSGKAPDTSGKAPEAEHPVVYTTVQTD